MVKKWEPYKDEIVALYEDHNVDDVIVIMKEKWFSASRRWYHSKFSEWNCQKASNRKQIAQRHPSREPSAKGHTSECFLNECPYAFCPSTYFPIVNDYESHRNVQRSFILDKFKWDSPQTTVGMAFKKYLSQYDRGQNYLYFFQQCTSPNPLDIIDCADVLLNFRGGSHVTMKCIIAREVTFSDAKKSLELLASGAGSLLGLKRSNYPQVVGWVLDFWMVFDSWGVICSWDSLQAHLFRIQDHPGLPISLKECVGTLLIQTFIERLEKTPSKASPLHVLLKTCEMFSIPLDARYIQKWQMAIFSSKADSGEIHSQPPEPTRPEVPADNPTRDSDHIQAVLSPHTGRPASPPRLHSHQHKRLRETSDRDSSISTKSTATSDRTTLESISERVNHSPDRSLPHEVQANFQDSIFGIQGRHQYDGHLYPAPYLPPPHQDHNGSGSPYSGIGPSPRYPENPLNPPRWHFQPQSQYEVDQCNPASGSAHLRYLPLKRSRDPQLSLGPPEERREGD